MIAAFTAQMVELRSALEVEEREREDRMAELLERFEQAQNDAAAKLQVCINSTPKNFYSVYLRSERERRSGGH